MLEQAERFEPRSRNSAFAKFSRENRSSADLPIGRREINRRHETHGTTALTFVAARGPIPERYSDPGMHLRCVPSPPLPSPSCRMRKEWMYVSTDEPTCAEDQRRRACTYVPACMHVRARYPGCRSSHLPSASR